MTTDRLREMATLAGVYAKHPRPRLIHLRASGRVVLAALAMPDGATKLVRATTADHAELDTLSPRDRARVRSAFLSLNREAPDAVA